MSIDKLCGAIVEVCKEFEIGESLPPVVCSDCLKYEYMSTGDYINGPKCIQYRCHGSNRISYSNIDGSFPSIYCYHYTHIGTNGKICPICNLEKTSTCARLLNSYINSKPILPYMTGGYITYAVLCNECFEKLYKELVVDVVKLFSDKYGKSFNVSCEVRQKK